MCGRYSIFSPKALLAERFQALPAAGMAPTYNAAPTQQLPVILNSEPSAIRLCRWGLIPSWAGEPQTGRPLINARADTLMEKPSFREPFQLRRCLVLADGFYEWRREGAARVPHRVALPEDEPFAFAGLWDLWTGSGRETIASFAIITTEPTARLREIHERMPVILKREDEKAWLESRDPEQARSLLGPYAGRELQVYPVSDLVNSARNDSERILQRRTRLLWES